MAYAADIAGGLAGGVLMLCLSLRQRARRREKRESESGRPMRDLTESSVPKFRTDLSSDLGD